MEDKSVTETANSATGVKQSSSDQSEISISISKKTLKNIAIFASVALAVIVGILVGSFMQSSNRFSSAISNCDLEGSTYITVDQNGKGIYLDGSGTNNQGGLSSSALTCVLSELRAPNSLIERMNHTTALMGAQSSQFNGIQVEWTYHPNNGLDISFTQN